MEIKEFNEQFIQPNLPKTKKEWVWFVLVILIVVTLGLVSVNSYLGIQYKAELIISPCNLCEEYQKNIIIDGQNIDLSNLNFTKP